MLEVRGWGRESCCVSEGNLEAEWYTESTTADLVRSCWAIDGAKLEWW